MIETTAKSFEVTSRVQLCAEGVIAIAGHTLKADATKAYVEFRLAHSFPVVTSDFTTMHPQTVANSFQSMLHQVFNVGHIMKDYNPEENYRDRIIGSVVAVEFPPAPLTGWRVQGQAAKAPGIRAAAVIHKRAEWVDRILSQHLGGRKKWTVSMENTFPFNEAGFLVKDKAMAAEFKTPEDILDLGWTYVPYSDAPAKLQECFDSKKVCMASKWGKRDTLLMIGGLGGRVHYQGVGITPLGKEPTAEISTMLASGWAGVDLADDDETDGTIYFARMAPRILEF